MTIKAARVERLLITLVTHAPSLATLVFFLGQVAEWLVYYGKCRVGIYLDFYLVSFFLFRCDMT